MRPAVDTSVCTYGELVRCFQRSGLSKSPDYRSGRKSSSSAACLLADHAGQQWRIFIPAKQSLRFGAALRIQCRARGVYPVHFSSPPDPCGPLRPVITFPYDRIQLNLCLYCPPEKRKSGTDPVRSPGSIFKIDHLKWIVKHRFPAERPVWSERRVF